MIFIVNGCPSAGKTTFESIVEEKLGKAWCLMLSTAEFPKQIATLLGWNGLKTNKDRKFLSDLKKLLTEWNDLPIKFIKQEINNYYTEITQYGIDFNKITVFIDCREPDEIDRLCRELGAKSICIRNRAAEAINEKMALNDSDRNILNYKYDIEISNDGSLEDLRQTVDLFIEQEILQHI